MCASQVFHDSIQAQRDKKKWSELNVVFFKRYKSNALKIKEMFENH